MPVVRDKVGVGILAVSLGRRGAEGRRYIIVGVFEGFPGIFIEERAVI